MNLPHAATAATEDHFGTTRAEILSRLHDALNDLTAFDAYRDATLTQLAIDGPEPPYTVKEAARALNVCPSTVREMVHDGRLARVAGTGKAFRISRAAVAQRISQQ